MLSDSSTKQGIHFKDILKNQSAVRRKPGRPPKHHPPGTINGIIAECAVCHDRATGLHYAVMTCEGCKGFFKRSIQADKTYKCRNKGDCIISKESRNACQACRMKRCFKSGMKDKLVRDDRTPGNRKKVCRKSSSIMRVPLSDNSDIASDHFYRDPVTVIKPESTSIEDLNNFSLNQYSMSCKKVYGTNYCGEISDFNYGDMSFSTNSVNHDVFYNSISPTENFEDLDMSFVTSEVISDANSTDVIQHITSVHEQSLNNMDNSLLLSLSCSEDQDRPMRKCRQSPKCMMHLLTKLMKAKPMEPAFCKYFEGYPTSEQLLDCFADEIHLIIKFAKKTPGFCDLSMIRKLNVVQKNSLSILFIRIIYRSLSCPINQVQFASNICLHYSNFDKISILSNRFLQSIIELISSFKSLNLDIYELCLIQYAILEEEDWDPEIHYYPLLDGFDKPTRNMSQTYLKMYTNNKYPDQPHRWIFIMLSLTQVQEIVTIFTTQCIEMVKAQRIVISNDILKEIFSI